MDDYESVGDRVAEECGTISVEFGGGGDIGYSVEAVSVSEMLMVGMVSRASGELSMVLTYYQNVSLEGVRRIYF